MDWILTYIWPLLVAALDLVLASSATVHIVLRKRETRAAIGWVALVWLSPFIGAIVYFLLGINRIQRRAVSLRNRERRGLERRVPLTDTDLVVRDEFRAAYPSLAQLASLTRTLTGNPITPGNRVEKLRDGDEAYPAMLEAIDRAERSVALLTYIFDSDRAGDAFLERLIAAKNRGVEVRVLIDAVGSRYSRPNMLPRLREAGLKAHLFLPTRALKLLKYANLRNHRKILVVDGRVGFTGGTNIREGHWLSLEPKFPVECLHFRFEGPVVAHLQETFAEDWAFSSGESIDGDLWFPPPERAGEVWASGIPDGPDEDLDKLPLTIVGALACASRSVDIVTPYFLPEAPVIQALNVAALRGVAVRVLLPSENNIALVQWASSALLSQILERGCRVFFSPPPFDHTKLFVVDELWALVGSTNWDPRSLRLNFEFNVQCYSPEFAGELGKVIDEKIGAAEELSLERLSGRSLPVRFRDGAARLLSPYL